MVCGPISISIVLWLWVKGSDKLKIASDASPENTP